MTHGYFIITKSKTKPIGCASKVDLFMIVLVYFTFNCYISNILCTSISFQATTLSAMSSVSPQRNKYSNPIETEMTENEHVRIEIRGNIPDNNKIGVIKEWEGCLTGKEVTKRYDRQRHIDRVPPLLLKGKRDSRNREYYEPVVVSLGPYHHNRTELAQAENYKLITLEEFRLSCNKTMGFLYNKVSEVVQDARNCYIDGSTDDYNDEEFTRMMLRDACFVLFFIECVSTVNINKAMLNNEYLGALGFAHVMRDIFLLENQIPFVVLEVLLEIRFDDDKGEGILNKFFNYLNYGEVITRNEKVLENKQPLHLLELYRSYFISLPASLGLGSTRAHMWPIRRGSIGIESDEDFNYVKRNRSFASVMELKAKGIFLKSTYKESSNEDIKFVSHCCYGELELVSRAVSANTKAIYLNLIAYEMCAHNPNDFRISTYIRVMKSLVVHRDDVKELRNNNILLHSLGRDEEVVKMYDEIEAPAVNLYMFSQLRREIEKHCNSKYKTWAAELITVYFSSPWKTVALLVASCILFTSFLQTYFTVRPLPDDPNPDIMKLLRNCVHIKAPPSL
ncbi:hypothetical protein L1987_59935 [Smallanthus sonchifolius]|uniref:Uncharacterized protein n=1 Tax=Smallanthus sonchifolius TaxID=185202 RepID=A0ACB9D6W6_9ASTR|nr:hypothetical protein L1987_59935 [Smallanthus sonchifolius]